MEDHDESAFEGGDAGASRTVPMQAGAIKKNGHVMIKGKPCKVVETSTSKTGKHGHAKVHIVGVDIFTSKKLEDICPTSHNMDVPLVKRSELQLLDIVDGFASLLLENGDTKEDLKMPVDSDGNPDDTHKQIKEFIACGKPVLVTVLAACGEEKIIGAKEFSVSG